MLTTNQLIRFIQLHHQLGKHFAGVFSINTLPSVEKPIKSIIGLIVNTDSSNLPGEHWIAIVLFPNGRGEVFDSFGQLPPSQIQQWMNHYCLRGWTFNTKVLQSPLSTLCGGYCLVFLYHRIVYGMPLKTFVHCLLERSNTDTYVKNFLSHHNMYE